jgi:hypothetical protein
VNQKLPFTKTHLQHLVKDASLQNIIYKIMQGLIGVTARLTSEGSDLGKVLPYGPRGCCEGLISRNNRESIARVVQPKVIFGMRLCLVS